ncbi:hypothetical protein UP09_23845 [Bradyrhizobium sp. LTSP885]|uniref:DUF3658 domain-containing protein n=1 Tax=Bradyrhizobium sp. LTSP885 TaxID=1619232 RepID=UPI0005CA504A|nr:DUF3658 domain-containing protein [Bradyrhizobium sp. LTSP885]KJC40081.1 hypothetical protein UP09_23845 [Bradyrhizobium sp. LTSP885]
MNREQAEEILDHLILAARELDEAKAAAAILEDRDADVASLNAVVIRLSSELLDTIFERFPDLVPFSEFPEISSSLRWDQVQLPPTVSEAQVDEIVSSVIVRQWRKMARIVGDAVKRGGALDLKIPDEVFAARIQLLVDVGRCECQGDLRKWRHSEVRLKN